MKMLQGFIARGRSTCSSGFFKESKILWTKAASHHPSHPRTAHEIPVRSGSSMNERVRSRFGPGDLGMVSTSGIRRIIAGQDSQSTRVC